MKKLSLLIALLVMLPSPVLAQWQWVNPKPTGENILDWSVVNPQVHVALGEKGFILKTVDGGQSWAGQYAEEAHNLRAISFASLACGYAVDAENRILKSEDGGVTWRQLYRADQALTGVLFLSADRGFVVGNNGVVLSTRDGGSTWTRTDLTPTVNLQRVIFVNESLGFILSSVDCYSNGHYWKTTDGGTTWVDHAQSLPYAPMYLRDLSFFNDSVGYAVLRFGCWPSYCDLYKTEDAGETWQYVRSLDSSSESIKHSIFFQEDGSVLVVLGSNVYRLQADGGLEFLSSFDITPRGISDGRQGPIFVSGSSGAMVRSGDGGTNWSPVQQRVLPEDLPLLQGGLFTGLACGYLFHDTSILKTSDAGLTWRSTVDLDTGSIRSLSFPSDQVGYAAGDDVWKTMDGGESWSKIYSSVGFDVVQFVSDGRGFAAQLGESYCYGGGYGGYGGYGAESCPTGLWMTTTGGTSWEEITELPPLDDPSGIAGFHFPTPNIGYVARRGDWWGQTTEIWKVTIGSDNQTITAELVYEFSAVAINAILFQDEKNGLVGAPGKVYQTQNGGASWVQVLDLQVAGGPIGVQKILYDRHARRWWVFTEDGQIYSSQDNSSSSWSYFWGPGCWGDLFLHPAGIWAISCCHSENDILKYTLGDALSRPPEAPINFEPPNGGAVPQTTVTLKTSPFSDQNPEDTHVASQWQVATDSAFAAIVLDTAPDPSNLTTYPVTAGLAYGQTYYFHVRHEDSTGLWSDWSQPTSFVINHPPDTPSLNPALAPPDSVFYTTGPTLVFTDYHDQESDPHRATEVRVSRGTNCDQLIWGVVLSGGVTQATVPSGVLQYGETYCIQVRYQDGNIFWSEWSAPEQMKVSSGPRQPINQRPAAEAEVDSVQLEASAFTDDFAAQGASHWQISRGEDFLCIVFEVESTSGDLVRLTPPNVFVSERIYSWRVRYRNVHGAWSPWSQPTSFAFVLSP